MPIAYKDFLPAISKSGFFTKEYETLTATIARVNDWIHRSSVTVLNVETVVLPNISDVEDASQVGIRTSGEVSSYWFQVVRVWYEDGASKA